MSYVALAKAMGLAEPSVHKRVRILERNGIIRGYQAKLDPKSLGFAVTSFILIALKPDFAQHRRGFEGSLQISSMVQECHILSDSSMLLRCVAARVELLQRFVIDHLLRLAGVATVKTLLVIHCFRMSPAYRLAWGRSNPLLEALVRWGARHEPLDL